MVEVEEPMPAAKTPDSVIENILLLGQDTKLTYKEISLAINDVVGYKDVWRVLHGLNYKKVRPDIPRRTHEPKIKVSDEVVEQILILGQNPKLTAKKIERLVCKGKAPFCKKYVIGILTGIDRKGVRPDLPRRVPEHQTKTPDNVVEGILFLGQDPKLTCDEISRRFLGRVAKGAVSGILTGRCRTDIRPDLPRRKVSPITKGIRPKAELEELRQKALILLGQGIGPKAIAKKLGKSSGCIFGLLGFGGKPYIRSHCTCCKLPRAEGHTKKCVVGKWLSRNDHSKKDALERQAKEIREYNQYAQECSQRSKARTQMKKEQFLGPAKQDTCWNENALAQVKRLQAEGWEVFRVTNSRRPTRTPDGRFLMDRYDVQLVTKANGRHAGDITWSTWAIRLKSGQPNRFRNPDSRVVSV